MKKILTTTFVILTLFSVSFGQKLQIGIRGGLGKTQLSSQKVIEDKFIIENSSQHWNAGISIGTKINKRLFWETEINLSQKGTVYYEYLMDYMYLGISPSLKVKLRKNNEKHLQPFAKIGIYAAYLSRFSRKVNFKCPCDLPWFIEYNQPRNFDFGFNTSLGLDYSISKKMILSFDASYEQGLRDVFGKENVPRKSIYNLAAWGNVGLKFNF
jgi:Outer membrane protein beta-barrel domain